MKTNIQRLNFILYSAGYSDDSIDLLLKIYAYIQVVDDIYDDEFDKVKPSDSNTLLYPLMNWGNNVFYMNNKCEIDVLLRTTVLSWDYSNNNGNLTLAGFYFTVVGYIGASQGIALDPYDFYSEIEGGDKCQT